MEEARLTNDGPQGWAEERSEEKQAGCYSAIFGHEEIPVCTSSHSKTTRAHKTGQEAADTKTREGR